MPSEVLVQAAGHGRCLIFQGRPLLPLRDPQLRLQEKIANFPRNGQTLWFCPSPLLGYGLDLLSRTAASGDVLLTCEAEPVLQDLPWEVQLDPRMPCVKLNGVSESKIQDFFSEFSPGRFRRVQLLPLSGGYQLNRGTYERLKERLEQEIRTFWRNRATLTVLGPLYVKHLFKNLAALRSSQARRLPLSLQKPVILAGAGPSLELSLAPLKTYRNKIHLVCVDSAAPVLAQAGLHPDIVVVLETQIHNLADLLGTSPSTELWLDLSCHPSHFRWSQGPVRWFASRFAPSQLWPRLEATVNVLDPFGSVGVTALDRLLTWTDQALGLVGLDFCHTVFQSHARGSPSHLKFLERQKRQVSWPLPFGQPEQETRLPQGGLVSPTLERYGQLARQRLRNQEHRVYDLRPASTFPLGLPACSWEDFVNAPVLPEKKRPLPSAFEWESLWRTEKEKLLALWESFEKGQLQPDQLMDVDYLTVSFPDRETALEHSHGLARLKASLKMAWEAGDFGR